CVVNLLRTPGAPEESPALTPAAAEAEALPRVAPPAAPDPAPAPAVAATIPSGLPPVEQAQQAQARRRLLARHSVAGAPPYAGESDNDVTPAAREVVWPPAHSIRPASAFSEPPEPNPSPWPAPTTQLRPASLAPQPDPAPRSGRFLRRLFNRFSSGGSSPATT